MKKFLNHPDAFVDEMLEGVLAAHSDRLRLVGDARRGLVRAGSPPAGKVAVVTGGGSGHLPMFLGYVGDGLLAGAAVGNVFSAQSSESALDVTRAVHGGAGVLYLYGNYNGDRLNFDLAADLAELEGITTRSVRVSDDVGSAPRDRATERRGVAGLAFVYKCAGAAAARGDDLAEVERVARKAAGSVASMGVGLAPTILPAAGRPTFELADGEMEIGIGIHGEPGPERGPLLPADEVAARLLTAVSTDLGLTAGDRVAVLVNGLGATPPEELYVLFRAVHAGLSTAGVGIHRALVGEYATSLEMAGASLSLLRLDDELTDLFDRPAASPFVRFDR